MINLSWTRKDGNETLLAKAGDKVIEKMKLVELGDSLYQEYKNAKTKSM